jgi:uncharacterized ferritin-like protein (DUF455 family)
MRSAVPVGTKIVCGVEVRDDPAREACFQIVHLHDDLPDKGGMDVEHRRQRLHREYNQEVQAIEVAALCLADFPDAPWGLRLELARQCWDEARHALLYYEQLKAIGGYKGECPIANLDWSVVAMLDSLPARLAIQHRTFEAGSLDIEGVATPMLQDVGAHETADMVDAIEADEIHHVRFGNEWLKRMIDANPRAVLQVAAAVAWLKRVVEATGRGELHDIPTEQRARKLAGFSDGEISEVVRLERERSLRHHQAEMRSVTMTAAKTDRVT